MNRAPLLSFSANKFPFLHSPPPHSYLRQNMITREVWSFYQLRTRWWCQIQGTDHLVLEPGTIRNSEISDDKLQTSKNKGNTEKRKLPSGYKWNPNFIPGVNSRYCRTSTRRRLYSRRRRRGRKVLGPRTSSRNVGWWGRYTLYHVRNPD